MSLLDANRSALQAQQTLTKNSSLSPRVSELLILPPISPRTCPPTWPPWILRPRTSGAGTDSPRPTGDPHPQVRCRYCRGPRMAEESRTPRTLVDDPQRQRA